MLKKYIQADYTKKHQTKAFLEEVDKLYFNGFSLEIAIKKASDKLTLRARERVRKWIKRNF